MILSILIIAISFIFVNSFTPSSIHYTYLNINNNVHNHDDVLQQSIVTSTQLYGKANKKKSMAQKRKQRGNKFTPKPMERPKILDTVPNPDEWTPTASTDEKVQEMKKSEAAEKEVKSQAASLIQTQRRSVEVLTYVKEKVQGLDPLKAIESVLSPNGCDKVFDDFVGEELSSEMRLEGLSMFDKNKMELDLNAGVYSGEYAVALKGGVDQYADSPRITEFVVSLTRHLTNSLNQAGNESGEKGQRNPSPLLGYELDETASAAGLRTFNRKARMSSIALLTGKDVNEVSNDDMKSQEQRPFQYVNEGRVDNDKVDYRKVTIIYYMTPPGWDATCGGGVTIKSKKNGSDISVEAKNDRIIILSSDKCLHRLEEWVGGEDGRDSASMLVMHFVERREVKKK